MFTFLVEADVFFSPFFENIKTNVQNFYVSNFRFGVPICFFWMSKYEIGTPK